MKAQTTLLVSVLLNLGLVAATAYYFKSSPDASVTKSTTTTNVVGALNTKVAREFETNYTVVTNNGSSNFSWHQVESPEYKIYIANLRSVQCPEETIRDIIYADVTKQYAQKFRALRNASGRQNDYWKGNRVYNKEARDLSAQYRALEREKSALLKELLGVDPAKEERKESGNFDYYERQYSFLPEEKQDQVRSVMDKYNDLQQEIYRRSAGAFDAEDQKQLRELRNKKLAELAQFLTPQELEEFELRSSQTANQLRSDVEVLNLSEAEFRELYKLRTARADDLEFYPEQDDKEGQERRKKAVADVDAQVKTFLGDERYAEYERAKQYDYRQLVHLAERYDLPKQAAIDVFDMKKTAEDYSRKVRENHDLTKEQRDAKLKQIEQETIKALNEKLGEKAYKSYKNRGGWWISNLGH